ncbi:hypothetical protein [Methyloceanibacter caenitepidi]|uniref:Uncharacterized protein n=1 Tax=Methyloceanibacter caenitepidi TaxID=1384459 RepID=A0A0A8K771_9HYPH|nr:hypothetical protein [Methyloceanibacter caenitepidi]BAQ18352.1 hypothetical protein GL4_2919 [Methyloceanibacter caenitepidi]
MTTTTQSKEKAEPVAAPSEISLRDWFATHALGFGFDWTNVHETGGYSEAAQVAYEIADAMLAERDKP